MVGGGGRGGWCGITPVVRCPGMEEEVVAGGGGVVGLQGYLLLILLLGVLPTTQRNCQHLPPKEDQVWQ